MSRYAKTPTIYQMEAAECGAASLAMVFAYFGHHISLEQLRMETEVSRDGCNAGNIMRVAKLHGLECHAYKKGAVGLKKLQPPCIIHWEANHFVVFEGFKGKYAYINDPALGRRKFSLEELTDSFSGIVLTFQATKNLKKTRKKDEVSTFFLERILNQYGTLWKFLLTGILLVLPGVVTPVLFQLLIDEVILAGNVSWFSSLVLGICSLLLLQAILAIYKNNIMVRLQKRVVLFSAYDFLYKLFRLPISFYEQRYASDLSDRVNSNTKVSSFLSGELTEVLFQLVVSVFYVVWFLIYSPWLTVIALLSVLVNLILMKKISESMAYSIGKLRQSAGKLAGVVCGGLSITSTIKASGAETEYVGRILDYHEKKSELEQKVNKYQQTLNAFPTAIKMLTDVMILLLGGVLVMNGDMTIGMLIAFIALFGAFSQPVEKLVGFIKSIQTTRIDSMRVEDIMHNSVDDKFKETLETQDIRTKLDGEVELLKVSFGYSTLKPPIVSEISFKIVCGSSIAIIGASGCGKSTIAKLISGLYTPWSGELLFDGIPAGEIPNEIWNASVSTVNQNITLFSGSIRDNITMWNSNISEEDMIAAAKDACIHDEIARRPGAYEFQLTERASNLSGGQRQRLEIARALATNPTILIMDEATSALDAVVEKKILDNIKRRGCTCIIVAHRLSAIRDCDWILEMDKGKIVHRGDL